MNESEGLSASQAPKDENRKYEQDLRESELAACSC